MEILNDFSTSVRKALEEIDPNYEQIVIGASDEGEVKQNGPEATGPSSTG